VNQKNKRILLIVAIIVIAISISLGLIIFGSQYALDKYKNENPRPICNETINETNIHCYDLNHPEGAYVIYSGFVFLGGNLL
jgi:hypothetical protein